MNFCRRAWRKSSLSFPMIAKRAPLTAALWPIARSSLRRLRCGTVEALRSPLAGARLCKTRQRRPRSRSGTLATKRPQRRLRTLTRRFRRDFPFRRARRRSFLARWRREIHAGAASFGKSDGDRLLRGPGAMHAFPHMVHFFANKFTSLRGWRSAFLFVAFGASHGFLFRHKGSLETWFSASLYFTDWQFYRVFALAQKIVAKQNQSTREYAP